MNAEEEDLFLDDYGTSQSYGNRETRPIASSSSAVAVKKLKKLNSTEEKRENAVACVLCFTGGQEVRQCRKCFVKVCKQCRERLTWGGSLSVDSWVCGTCASGGSGIDVLLQAPARRQSKVTRKGRGSRSQGKTRSLFRRRRS